MPQITSPSEKEECIGMQHSRTKFEIPDHTTMVGNPDHSRAWKTCAFEVLWNILYLSQARYRRSLARHSTHGDHQFTHAEVRQCDRAVANAANAGIFGKAGVTWILKLVQSGLHHLQWLPMQRRSIEGRHIQPDAIIIILLYFVIFCFYII